MGDFIFTAFPVLFVIMFALVFGMIISNLVRSARRHAQDSASPRLTVDASVVAKRTQVGTNRGANNTTMRYTDYFATFQFESGDRLELEIDGSDYGLLVEGDRGRLTFQGRRYLGFERS